MGSSSRKGKEKASGSHHSSRSSKHASSSKQASSSASTSSRPRNTSEESILLGYQASEQASDPPLLSYQSTGEQGERWNPNDWYLEDTTETDPTTGKEITVRRWVRWSRSDTGPAQYLHQAGMGGRPDWSQPYTMSNAPMQQQQQQGNSNDSGGAGYPPQHTSQQYVKGKVRGWARGMPNEPSGYTGTPVAGSYPTSVGGNEGSLRADDDFLTYNLSGSDQQAYANLASDPQQAVGYMEGAGQTGHQAQRGQWCRGGIRCAGLGQCTCLGGENCTCSGV